MCLRTPTTCTTCTRTTQSRTRSWRSLTLDIRPLTPAVKGTEYLDLTIRAFGPLDEARVWAIIEPILADGRGVGAFDDGRLVGSAVFHDMRQWWYGKQV